MTTTPESPDGGAAAASAPVAPPGARFDPVTGAELGAGGTERRESFALQPGEPVMSFNMVTSLMPLASGSAPQTYRWALGLGLLIPVIAGALGYLAFAFVAAALVVPAIYVVYMYDVNEWEDQPVPVVLGTIGAAAALGVGFTFLWHAGLLGDDVAPVDFGQGAAGVRWSSLLVLVLLVPIVSELLKQVGPLFLASRPQFDDMIDGLTFGVAAGASFAAAETIVVNRSLFSSFGSIDSPDAGFWVSLILSAAIVKPIVYGAATGIAVAAWSGLGSGFEGFKPAYLRGLGEALLANILFQGGLYLASRVEGTAGAVIGLVWGALIAGVLVVRLRYLLHFAVLEAALEGANSGSPLKDAARGTAYCPSCDMPLLDGANFCVVCGTATRAGSKVTRLRNRTPDAEVAAKPSLKPVPAGVAPRDNSRTAVVVGAVVAAIVLGGAIGQGVAAAGADDAPLSPDDSGIVLEPDLGAGPTTEDAPEPADPPGPDPDPAEESDGSSTESSAKLASFSGALTDELTDEETATDDGSGGIGGGPQPDDPSGSDIVDLGVAGFRVPDGWEVEFSETGFAQLWGPGGYFIAVVTPSPAEMEGLITDHLNGLVGFGVQELEYTQPEAVSLPTSAVVEAQTLFYRGLMATQQGGTFPVEGFGYYFITQDGTGITAFGLYEQGALDSTPELVDGYNAMLNDLVSTIQ
ncbi:PrsW family glutamic-type intramembrane protease [Nocardioides dilutus]